MKKLGQVLLTILGIVSGAWLIIYLWPAKKRPKRAFERAEDPAVLNIAHRGGRGLAPEGTLAAFENARRLEVDMFEYDTHITKDGHLVVIHDATVNRTTNGVGWVNELTLAEVQALDAGYNFIDQKGQYSFRDQGVYIPTVVEVFQVFPNMRHLIEIKDTNDVALYEAAIQELWHLIQEHGMEDNVMVGSFNQDIIERFEAVTWGQIPIGAGEDEVRKFVTMHIPYLNGLAGSNVDSLQIPTKAEGFDLTTPNLIKSAKNRNMSLYYWTINDEETMRDLIAKGVDGIITDYPDRLRKVLVEVQAGI
jgi:glycerophosphoryl diester phosphodiesterase